MGKDTTVRVADVETAGGEKASGITLGGTEGYISRVANGQEDFVIFNTHDGFLQFYGVGNQFICEAWFNSDGRRAYGIINPNCTNAERVDLVTPYGQFTPRGKDILSLAQLKTAVQEYFLNVHEADFLAKIPHEDLDM